MNERITRVSLDDVSGMTGRTDWERLRALTDDEIDASIRADPDTFTAEVGEWLGREGDAHRYYVYSDQDVFWRWRFVGASGEVIAESGHGYESRDEVMEAIQHLRRALPETDTKAA